MHIPYKKIFKYGIGGWVWALTDLLFLYIFTEYFGIYYLLSQVLSFLISVFVWFLFQKYITFQQKWGSFKLQSSLFLWFQVIGILANIGIMWLLVEYAGLYYMYASIIAKWIVFGWNFYMNHKYNFK